VIVYGHRCFRLDVPAFLRDFLARLEQLPASPDHDAIVELLIDFGEAYSAAADTLFPGRDDDADPLRLWSDAAQALADALVASWHHDTEDVQGALARARRSTDAIGRASPIRVVSAKTAEGFAFYGLYPEQYILAAEEAVRSRGESRMLTCIGIRSIGAPLAHVVSAAAARLGVSSQVFTVRPRGHPFDRRLEMSERLSNRMRERSSGWFAIVDEGPGLSGSSFAAASDALIQAGIDANAIVLFPSWRAPGAALRSDRGRRAIERHAHVIGRFEDVISTDGLHDLSGGRWRERVFGVDERRWPAVQPQHERRKYATPNRGIMRFVGLGRYGRERRERALALAAGGFSPAPLHLCRGFLTTRWIDGEPLSGERPPTLTRVADYLAFLRRSFAADAQADVDDIIEMIHVNVGEELGTAAVSALEPIVSEGLYFDEPLVAIDGRMQPHEWILSNGGELKIDALDHHADDFFPGERDIAWDVAGAIVELGLDEAAARDLVAAYRGRTRDRKIGRRLRFYETAYLAYRLGYAALAAETLADTADGRRFTRLRARYRRSLEALAAHPRAVRRH
jgi:hypothetical protein